MSSWLECLTCGARPPAHSSATACGACGGELLVCYPPGAPLAAAGPGIFRFAGRLPVDEPTRAVSLGEGDTPLVDASGASIAGLGVARVRVKCESVNPTGSFKDRIAAVAATLMRERGLAACVGTSSGNGGAAMAAYASRVGARLLIFALSDTVPQKLLQIRASGGHVVLLQGLGHDADVTGRTAARIVRYAARARMFPFVTASRFSPEAMEGAKTVAYELAEQAPEATVVYVPIGGGGLFSAIWRGYAEIAGELPNGAPRLVAVQPSGCPTIRRLLDVAGVGSVEGGGAATSSGQHSETTISGLQVASLFDATGVTTGLRGSRGHYVEVDDAHVWEVQRQLASEEGILVEPAGATALAGAVVDAACGRLDSDDDVVVVATGAGYKDTVALERIVGDVPLERCGPDEIATVLGRIGGRSGG